MIIRTFGFPKAANPMDRRNRITIIFIIFLCGLFEIQQAWEPLSNREIWEPCKKGNNPTVQACQLVWGLQYFLGVEKVAA
jgi:hypothetical protein